MKAKIELCKKCIWFESKRNYPSPYCNLAMSEYYPQVVTGKQIRELHHICHPTEEKFELPTNCPFKLEHLIL